MKCRKCGKKALVNLKAYRISLCGDCFLEFYRRIVERSIKKYRIFKNDDKILVAVSGGKDSSAMASVLRELGHDFELLHIDLGIYDYSKDSRDKVKELSKLIEKSLHILELRDYGFTISEVKGKKCSICGTAKRYIMNRFARENRFTVIATGHTAEDITAFYLKNIAGGQKEYSEKLLPRTEPFDERVVARTRPIFEMSEKENMIYAILKNLPLKLEECPFAPNPDWKEIVYEIERRKPGFVKNFVRGIAVEQHRFEKKYCSICGEVSTREICSFCRIRSRFISSK
ncbi:MAG: ATP-binding protein [Archaeoglobaceae archaeon]|nr:adenine nucleotide alpha hydrolase family protein [Archaeoglobaceae archaeon]MDW7990367.1 ATP-binding protein [Archaeoglobaceae archaeon]